MGKSIKLQVFFIILKIYNILYFIFFSNIIRRLLLKLTGVKIGKNSIINASRFFTFGRITMGDNSLVNSGCYLDNRRGIYIGNNVVIAHDTKIYTLGHDYDDETFKTKGSPVYIDDYVIVFSNVLIMPGVHIEEGAVILSGAVVTKNVEKNAIVGGNPAKLIKYRKQLHTNKPLYKYWFAN